MKMSAKLTGGSRAGRGGKSSLLDLIIVGQVGWIVLR